MSINEYAKPILDGVYRLRNSTGQDASYAFKVLPPRKLVDYYEIIKRPMALDIIRKNIKQKVYGSFHDFVVDLAQITHNARVYNPPDNFIYTDALVIDKYLKESLSRLRKIGKLSESDLEYPDLGPLPQYSDVESMDSSDSDEGSATPDGRRRRPVRRSVLMARNKHLRSGESDDEDAPRKRGRPPTVDKPHEHRIKAILRAIRRERDGYNGRALHDEFDKLPDQKLLPDYYQEIANPIALDVIRKNIKRRKYNSVEEFMEDITLMFNNAKQFNPPDSQLYKDAETLESIANATAQEELKKPDSIYVETDSKPARVPLDQFQHRGETYQVGDWVHIENPNDPAKPIIGQIFRIWQADGKQWVNACWYYRPEQTVHQYTKCFYENEVVKSGQYRDHTVDQILEKCFVMFITKYQRGRPTGIGARSVYCCESRYNETDRQLTKIRTWKACIPDEVRSGDYPMDLFDRPQTLRRLASPIKNLLPADAKDTDPIPQPKMGSPNAPPIVGAVYKRPVDPNDPPETPTADPVNPRKTDSPATPAVVASPNPEKRPTYTTGVSNSNYSYSSRTTPGYNGNYGTSQLSTPGPSLPTAFSLPRPFVAGLRDDQLRNVAKGRDGQPLWFPACPIWVSHRYHSEPISHNLRFTIEGETPVGLTVPKGFGHSAKYLAWKANKAKANGVK